MGRKLLQLWPLALLVGLWCAFAAPFLLQGKVPFPTKYLVTAFPPWSATYAMPVKNAAMPDVITQIYPWKNLTIATWKRGQIPLWNPYSFAGTPHAGNYQSAVFSPFTLLYMVFAQPLAWSVIVLLQPLLAGIGMYWFVRLTGRSAAAASISGMAFMFCGFMTTWMAYGTLGHAALWLPYLFAGVTLYFRRPAPIRGALVAVTLAASFLAGHFQISLYVLGATLLLIASRMIRREMRRPAAGLLAYVMLGLLLALPQLWLTFDAYTQSVRSGSFVKGEIIPWRYLITMIAPDFYGNPVTRNDWFGHYAEWATYIGVVPLLLSLLGLSFRRSRETLLFAVLAAGALLLALPTPFSDALFALKLPVLSTSAASRIVILVSFSLAVLAAHGWDLLLTEGNQPGMRRRLLLRAGIFLLLLAGVWGIVLGIKPFDPEKLAIARRNLVLPSAFVMVAMIAILATTLKQRIVRVAVLSLLLLLSAGDMYRYAAKWMPFEPPEYLYPSTPMLAYLTERVDTSRVFGNIGNEVGSVFAVPLIEGYDAMYQGRYGEFIRSAGAGRLEQSGRSVVQLEKHGLYAEQVLQMLGVRYVVHRKSDGRSPWAYPVWLFDHYRQVYADDHYEIHENTKALPRAYLVSRVSVVSEPKQTIAAIFNPEFSATAAAVLETALPAEQQPQPGTGSAAITVYTPGNITVRTTADAPKLLVLSDVYDRSWQVRVNGSPAELYRTNYAFRGVPVPAGDTTVEFWYIPNGIRWGLPIAGLAALVLAVAVVRQLYENRTV